MPHRSPFIWAQILAVVNFACGVAVLTSIPILLLYPSQKNIKVLVACMASYMLTAMVSFLKRRKVLCPLCKGTPLVSSQAEIHPRASRIFPLDYGTSTLLTLIASQTFRCMYCASRFDLLKNRPEPRRAEGEK